MRRQMPRQIALLDKRLSAMLTLVRLFPGVGPLVNHQLPLPNERQRTEATLVRLFASMGCHLVPFAIRSVREHLFAKLALVRPDTGVAPFVGQELRFDSERQLADFAFPRLVVGVYPGMILVVALPRERFAAYFTTERTVRLVYDHVVLENGFRAESFTTNIAFVRFDAEMFVLVILQCG